MNIKDIPGFNEVSVLIPEGNFLKYTRVWSAKMVQVLTRDGNLTDGLFIVLADDYRDPKGDMIELGCLNPIIHGWPGKQIMGLEVEYYDMTKTHGWDDGYYDITDYEDNEINVRCKEVKLGRVALSVAVTEYREWV